MMILDDKSTARRAMHCWARENEAKVGAGVWMWGIYGSHSDDCLVGAAAVCKLSHQWRTRLRYLGTGRMEVFVAELWAIGPALGKTVNRKYIL
jgi:hypothetical protein